MKGLGDKAAQTRERILKAAETLFSIRGYEAISIDELCATVGLTKGAFYYHFKTKEEILSLLFIPRLDRYLAANYRVDDGASCQDRLLTLARCTFDCGRSVGPEVLSRSSASMLGGQQVLLHKDERIHTQILRGAWARGRAEGTLPDALDFRAFVLLYSSILTGVLLNWAAEQGQRGDDTDWDSLIALAITGVFPQAVEM